MEVDIGLAAQAPYTIKVATSRQPSAFGQTLCGPAFERRAANFADIIPYPYMSSPHFDPAAFQKPSPDDIVLAAQSKGSRFAHTDGANTKSVA
jgi:hypothetical protein